MLQLQCGNVSLTTEHLGKAMEENPGYLRLRKIRAAQAIAGTVSHTYPCYAREHAFPSHTCMQAWPQ